MSSENRDRRIPLQDALGPDQLDMSRASFWREVDAGRIRRLIHCKRAYVLQSWIDDYWAARASEGAKEQVKRRKRTLARRNTAA